MKKIVFCLGFLLLIITPSFSSEPLVFNESKKLPIKFVAESIPAAIGKAVEIKMKYEWRYWSKSEFEQKQNAAGKIKYTLQFGKFAGGRHSFGAKIKYEIKEEGNINFRASSYIGDQGSYGTGKGRLFVNVFCSYKGKDGKKHRGRVGAIVINVNFIAPR